MNTEMGGVTLLEGETVLEELRPIKMAKISFFAQWSAQYFLPTTILLLILAGPMKIPPPTADTSPIALILGYLAAVFVASSVYCRNLRYWITNMRVITKSGLTGSNIAQIPYSQIAYTTVAQSIYDRLLGLKNLYVKDTSGPRRYGRRGGIPMWKPECQLIGIRDPVGAQNRILSQKSICGQSQ